MLDHKIKAVINNNNSVELDMNEVLRSGLRHFCKTSYTDNIVFMQQLGYQDANDNDVYEGDVLELKITKELMNHNKNMFFNSSLGQYIEKEGDITSVILVNKYDKHFMSMDYELYFCKNNRIERDNDGIPYAHNIGDDKTFPQYLCYKGATIIGNIVLDKTILDNM